MSEKAANVKKIKTISKTFRELRTTLQMTRKSAPWKRSRKK